MKIILISINFFFLSVGLHNFSNIIFKECKINKINSNIVIALICVENVKWNPKAKSKTGDLGLMQIHSKNKKFFEPEYNLKFGIKKLSKLIKKYGLKKGLTAYNRGILGMEKYYKNHSKHPYYTRKIIKNFKILERLK